MAVPAFQRYPVPRSLDREIKNSYTRRKRPDGVDYKRGLHGGIDIPPSKPGKKGEPIISVLPGVVVETAPESQKSGTFGGSYGNRIIVEHRDPAGRRLGYSFYAHLDEIAPRAVPGKEVKAGNVLGWLGDTGIGSGPHLHFEWHPAKQWRSIENPYNQLEDARLKDKIAKGG